MEIRRTLPKDIEEIRKIEVEVFPDAWSAANITSLVGVAGAMCYTATEDGKVIAYLLGRQICPEGEIYRIATVPEYRRRGVAYRLLDYAVRCEENLGLESLFLEVREKNTAARALYTSYGFKEISVRRNYYKNPTDDAIIMLFEHSKDL